MECDRLVNEIDIIAFVYNCIIKVFIRLASEWPVGIS